MLWLMTCILEETDYKLELFNHIGKIHKGEVKTFLHLRTATYRSRSAFWMLPEEDQSCRFAVVLVKVGSVQWFAKQDLKQTVKQLIACLNLNLAHRFLSLLNGGTTSEGQGSLAELQNSANPSVWLLDRGDKCTWLCTADDLSTVSSRISASCFSTWCRHSWVLTSEVMISSLSRA